MCQLNLVFVKNSKNKKILENNEYNYFGEDFKSFSAYIKGPCNCGSFVGSMSEYTGSSYVEMIENLNTAELERLTKIKDFMNKPDYKKLKEKYIIDREALSGALEKFFEPISTYEMEQINLLETKYKGKALEKQMELLYKNLDKKLQEIENSSEYQSAQRKLNDFIEKNHLMEESTLYYLTKEDEENDNKSQEFLEDDLFEDIYDLNDAIEYVDIPKESFVIDTVIQRLQNRYQNDYNVFLEYKQLFENLLENEEYILFCCIWDEPENMSIEKEVNIKDIKIEDLASLEYNQVLKIYK